MSMRGTIVIHADAGRALRSGGVALLMAHILDCSGSFRAGDKVYVVVRGADGGQGVIATGVVHCDDCVSRRDADLTVDAQDTRPESDVSAIVIAAQDLELLWR
jgi:glutamate 5-kinase